MHAAQAAETLATGRGLQTQRGVGFSGIAMLKIQEEAVQQFLRSENEYRMPSMVQSVQVCTTYLVQKRHANQFSSSVEISTAKICLSFRLLSDLFHHQYCKAAPV